MQATIMMVNYVLAAGVLTLPRTTVEVSKTPDVWISVILGGVISMLAGIIIVKLSQRFPGQTLYQYIRRIVGKPLGFVIGVLIAGYFLCIAGFEIRSVQEVTSYFLLDGTPHWAIASIFLWVALYLCMGGINAIAGMCRLIVPITWTIFLGGGLLSLEVFELDNLRPVLGEGLSPVWKAIKPTALTYTAGDAMIFLVAFMDKPKKAVKVITIGTSIVMLFYIIAVVMTIGAFSIDGVVTRTWPYIDLIRSFEVRYFMFERFESMMLAIWIMQIFCTFCIAFYGASLGISQLLNKKLAHCFFVLLPIVYIVSELPPDLNGLFALGSGLGNWAILLFGLLPLPLLIIACFRRAGT
ncbi:GerAB/ArcD/ProY family transporter [Paenibacillus sp. sgz500958]|uniref:GerAB/ArcD/ProY family transporter n=1 Tax=Paenibacillus sp. sgz500958 TaxID=3242475 RepID=UPI0036D40289